MNPRSLYIIKLLPSRASYNRKDSNLHPWLNLIVEIKVEKLVKLNCQN